MLGVSPERRPPARRLCRFPAAFAPNTPPLHFPLPHVDSKLRSSLRLGASAVNPRSPEKASHTPDAGNQRLASNHPGKGGQSRSRSGKSRSVFPPPDRLFPLQPAFQPAFSD